MQIDEVPKIFIQMYHEALPKEKALSIHLFANKYTDQIRDRSAKNIAVGAGLPESYKTEIRKGINLTKYVEVSRP